MTIETHVIEQQVEELTNSGRLVGFAYIAMLTTFLIGFITLENVLAQPNLLITASEHETQIMIGVLFELLMGVCEVLIALSIYPVFRRFDERMAVGYLAFRIVEFVSQLFIDLGPLMLLSLSKQYVAAGQPDDSHYQLLADLFLDFRNWGNRYLSIPYFFGGLVLYSTLYRSKIVPRFVAFWGLIAAIGVIVANTILAYFIPIGILMAVFGGVMGANELFLAIYLPIRKFNKQSIREIIINHGP